jgi:hypothetical protein
MDEEMDELLKALAESIERMLRPREKPQGSVEQRNIFVGEADQEKALDVIQRCASLITEAFPYDHTSTENTMRHRFLMTVVVQALFNDIQRMNRGYPMNFVPMDVPDRPPTA